MLEQVPTIESAEHKKAYELALELESCDDPEVVKENIGKLLASIEADVHNEFLSEVGELYQEMAQEKCLVRVERLSRVLKAIEENEPIRVGEGAEHYANAATPELEGIQIAYAEGQAPGPVKSMIAFGKTLIGFKTDHIEVNSIDYAPDDIRDAQKRMRFCRHVQGELHKEDIKYLIMRIPKGLVGEDVLLPGEKENEGLFIFRGLRI